MEFLYYQGNGINIRKLNHICRHLLVVWKKNKRIGDQEDYKAVAMVEIIIRVVRGD